MDIAIEKINKLLIQQQIWKKRVEQAKTDHKELLTKKERLNLELNILLDQDYDLNIKKSEIFFGNQQIIEKEKKAKIRFWAATVILNIFISASIITIDKPLSILFLLPASNLILIPNFEILSGLKDCKSEKECLNNNTMEDINQKIEENKKKISLQKEKININNKEIKKMKDNILQMENFLKIFQERIEEINNIRKTVIDKFLTHNQELDNLINNSYLDYENKNKLVKKK